MGQGTFGSPDLDWGKMSEREILAANTIGMNTIGNHFSKSVASYLIKLIEAHTEPEPYKLRGAGNVDHSSNCS